MAEVEFELYMSNIQSDGEFVKINVNLLSMPSDKEMRNMSSLGSKI